MNVYFDEVIAGIHDTLALYKQGQNIFEIKGGSLFPNIDRQAMWKFSRGQKHLHLHDGQQTYSFGGELGDEDVDMEKLPDVPLPDLYNNSVAKGKAQVHRSDPGSVYFTLQEGNRNPTYTLRHLGDNKWRAIPKKKKVKEQLAAPAAIPNVNVESLKQGMAQELEMFIKESDGGAQDFFNHAAGKALTGGINGLEHLVMAPGRIGGAPSSGSGAFGNAAKAGLLGAGLGAGYDLLKRKVINTPEENEQEDWRNSLKRIGIPALGMAGLNMGQRSLFGPDPTKPESVDSNYYERAAHGDAPNIAGP